MNILVSKDGEVERLSTLSETSSLSIQPDTNKPQQNCLVNLIKLGLMGVSLLTLPLSGYAAISATTSKTIQGTEPYFTWNNVKITDFNDLLTVRYIDTSGVPAIATPPTTGTTATIAVGAAMKENDIETLISGAWSGLSGISTTSALSSSIGTASGALRVGDGDGDAATGAGASGTITATLLKDGQAIAPTGNSFDMCSTYQLELKVVPPTGGTINATTAFGDPKVSSAYTAQTVTYTLQPPVLTGTATVQFAKPNLTYGTGVHAGNPTEWSPTDGFILQNIATPSSNFPTTGFNGAFFDIKLSANDASKVIGCKDAGGNGEVSITVAPKPGTTDEVRVTLVGPTDAARPTGGHSPTTFRLTLGGSDIYTFTIGKWFIARHGVNTSWDVTSNPAPVYCTSLVAGGLYKVPSVWDYTNSTLPLGGGVLGSGGYGGNYKRAIGGGLFAEWGYTHRYAASYPSSDFEDDYYWANEAFSNLRHYNVYSDEGLVSWTSPSSTVAKTACVSP